jgi:2,4-dienoyl-CoA reductase (NADPH2)
MELARLASLRGHEVVLAEATDRLGGRFALAAATADPNAALLRWFEGEMERRSVEVRLESPLTADEIASAGFDETFLATGARWPRPDVPGAERSHVQTVDELRDWLAVESSPRTEKDVPLVVLGGNRAGIALAGVARSRGAEVTVLEPGSVFSAANGLVGRWRYVHEAQQAGIRLVPGADLQAIDDDVVHWTDADGKDRSTEASKVLVSSGAVADTTLLDAVLARGVAAHALGDCHAIGLVEGAMQRAAELVLGS